MTESWIVVDLVVERRQRREERVGDRVEDPVDEVLLAAQDAVGEARPNLLELGDRAVVDRHDERARDEDVDLVQPVRELLVGRRRRPHAVEHEQHVVVEVVELRALAEAQAVVERQRVEAEQLAERRRCRPPSGRSCRARRSGRARRGRRPPGSRTSVNCGTLRLRPELGSVLSGGSKRLIGTADVFAVWPFKPVSESRAARCSWRRGGRPPPGARRVAFATSSGAVSWR